MEPHLNVTMKIEMKIESWLSEFETKETKQEFRISTKNAKQANNFQGCNEDSSKG